MNLTKLHPYKKVLINFANLILRLFIFHDELEKMPICCGL